jgi:nucleoside-diphosphate-sugar epimerase
MILVTGATGNVGSAVVAELRAKGEPVRAFVRNEERVPERLPVSVELSLGDFEDSASIARALEAVDALFLSSADQPNKVQHETAVIDAAADRGVRRIVKTSTVGAGEDLRVTSLQQSPNEARSILPGAARLVVQAWSAMVGWLSRYSASSGEGRSRQRGRCFTVSR